MEKLIKCALGTKFKTEQLDSVMEVINATPNPSVAVEILLGLYEEPFFVSRRTVRDIEYIFQSFDKWSNQVSYTYTRNKKITIYIKKGTDKSLINKDNYMDFKVPYKDGEIEHMVITLDETEEITERCHADNWPILVP